MNHDEKNIKEGNHEAKEEAEINAEAGTQESEFKLTVRKLEMPVRPRGVLAE